MTGGKASAYKIWPRGRGINWCVVWPWSGHRVKIAIGKPMMFAEDADHNETVMQLRDPLSDMWQQPRCRILLPIVFVENVTLVQLEIASANETDLLGAVV